MWGSGTFKINMYGVRQNKLWDMYGDQAKKLLNMYGGQAKQNYGSQSPWNEYVWGPDTFE